MKILTLILVVFALSSCVTDSNKKATAVGEQLTQAVQKREATTELATRLYSRFHSNPTTQAQKDENVLIDYAVEKNLDVKRTNSGLYYLIHKQGKGANLVHNQPTKAHYQGYTIDGKVFDSSHKRGVPISFNVGQMIPGWNEALKFMNVGTKAQLLIPSGLAYGKRGFPGLIAPDTPLVFDLEVLPLTEG